MYKILDCNQASFFKPDNDKTILIRILDTEHKQIEKYPKFISYPNIFYKDNFFKVIELYFDDIDSTKCDDKDLFLQMLKENHHEPFSYDIASFLLKELNLINFDKSFDLVIHCRAGVSRSSSILISLNEIYKLNIPNLKESYPYYNNDVYFIMKDLTNFNYGDYVILTINNQDYFRIVTDDPDEFGSVSKYFANTACKRNIIRKWIPKNLGDIPDIFKKDYK